MNIREILARNLRQLCDAEGNVIRICREIPLNRQQFNKYLSASTMPHPRTLKKICSYFNISEAELLKPWEEAPSNNSSETRTLLSIPECQQICKNLSLSSLPEISSGVYVAHMVVSKSPIGIACSVIVVKTENNIATFRRLTNFSEPENSNWHYVRGDHRGVIIERANWLYFMGIADRGLSEPSMLSVQWLPLSPKVMSGTALVGSHSGPEALPLIIAPVPRSVSLKSVLKMARVLPLEANEISSVVRNAIHHRLSTRREPSESLDQI